MFDLFIGPPPLGGPGGRSGGGAIVFPVDGPVEEQLYSVAILAQILFRWTIRRSKMPPYAPSPTPTRIAKVKAGHGLFGGAEIWVSDLFPHMADWMSTNGIDLQVARLELKELLCCPCCRIFEKSTSNKF